jgi:hypothetical protein
MIDVDTGVAHNSGALWNRFSPDDYWRRNYRQLHAEDREIIRRVSTFFQRAFAGCPSTERRGIDVGSGGNIYPALLMLPWADQILLSDHSRSSVDWLQGQLADDTDPWPWLPFWYEMQEAKGYSYVDKPRTRLREVCVSEPGYSGVERFSIFDLPEARWDLGTMFFVAESITEDVAEFCAAVAAFVGALTPGAPFAAAFMAGSAGYVVAGTDFPAVPITRDDVERHLTELGVREPSVELLETGLEVRDGYAGMIVATGFASNRRPGRGS